MSGKLARLLRAVTFAASIAVLPGAHAQTCSPAELANDVHNCGSCGRDCTTLGANGIWTCESSQCVFKGCQSGFIDPDNNQSCDTACTFRSALELCNGLDDNCDGQIDEPPFASIPSPVQVCGVSPTATTPECTTQVGVMCNQGGWKCTFPANVCNNGNCAATAETCDGLDNNCDGRVNENVPNFGAACLSDAGLPAPGHGRCRTTGTIQCTGPNSVACSATKADCATLPGGCAEACNGIDDDCDGLVDEPFTQKGNPSAYFVKPAVTQIGAGLWITSVEASRPLADLVKPGYGNGWTTSAPAGATIDKTRACFVTGNLPWTNVKGPEAEQACTAIGGALCTVAQWQQACQATASCTWGYSTRGAQCTTASTASKYCNLGPTYDGPTYPDALLEAGSVSLANCWADWSSLQGNTTANDKVYDITGNARELVKVASNVYALAGGSFVNDSERGATCGNVTWQVDQNYEYGDVGFRCCFTSDPTQ